jgi:hypothetical protein
MARANLLSPRIPQVRQESLQSRSLIAWWPLSACTGSVAPEIVYDNHGRAVDISMVPEVAKWHADPTFGFVPEFDGSYQFRFPDTRLPLGASPRTISLWVNYTECPSEYIRGAFSYGVTSQHYAVIIGAGNTDRWQPPGALGISVWDTNLVATSAHNDGVWHHVAAVLDNSAWSLYVDGRLKNSKTLAQMPTDTWSSNYGFVGALNYGSYEMFWRGLVRDVRVYGRALSAAEIWTLYNPATRFDLWAMPRRLSWASPTETISLLHTTDALILGGRKLHCTNAVLKGEVTNYHFSSSYLVWSITKVHSADALLQKFQLKKHTADADLKGEVRRYHRTAAYLGRWPRVQLYDLLPLIIRIKDAEASGDVSGGPILKQIVGMLQEQFGETEELIAGLKALYNVVTTNTEYLTLINQLLGSSYYDGWTDDLIRFFTSDALAFHKMHGTVFGINKKLKYRSDGKYSVSELYKHEPNEMGDYSLNKNGTHTYKAARVAVFPNF